MGVRYVRGGAHLGVGSKRTELGHLSYTVGSDCWSKIVSSRNPDAPLQTISKRGGKFSILRPQFPVFVLIDWV